MTSILHVLLLVGITCQTCGQVQVDSNCDFYQFLEFKAKDVYSPNYPSNYLANTKCRWIVKVPIGYKIKLDCTTVALPQSQNCGGDRISVSLTGSPDFVDGQDYCGTGTFHLTSNRTSMSIGLFTLSNQGKFSCNINASVDPTSVNPRPPIRPRGQIDNCECGLNIGVGTRILGGSPTGVGRYPWLASLIDTSPVHEISLPPPLYVSTSFTHLCGATIIHFRYAITAAHCVENRDPNVLGLLVGDYNVTSGLDTQANAIYKLLNYTSNAYNENTQLNDIAIVRTRYDMTYSIAVSPICLPFRLAKRGNSRLEDEQVLVLGWGATEPNGPRSDVPMSVHLEILSNDSCQTDHRNTYHEVNNTIYPSQICTWGNEKDACASDSGGPVVYSDSCVNRYFLVGVVSYGTGCGGYPGVNTRVTSYLTWILQNTPDATYCKQ